MFNAILLIGAGVFGALAHYEWVRWRRFRCDACRIELDGGAQSFLVHTCSRRNALYRDKKGNVTEFGQRRS